MEVETFKAKTLSLGLSAELIIKFALPLGALTTFCSDLCYRTVNLLFLNKKQTSGTYNLGITVKKSGTYTLGIRLQEHQTTPGGGVQYVIYKRGTRPLAGVGHRELGSWGCCPPLTLFEHTQTTPAITRQFARAGGSDPPMQPQGGARLSTVARQSQARAEARPASVV